MGNWWYASRWTLLLQKYTLIFNSCLPVLHAKCRYLINRSLYWGIFHVSASQFLKIEWEINKWLHWCVHGRWFYYTKFLLSWCLCFMYPDCGSTFLRLTLSLSFFFVSHKKSLSSLSWYLSFFNLPLFLFCCFPTKTKNYCKMKVLSYISVKWNLQKRL